MTCKRIILEGFFIRNIFIRNQPPKPQNFKKMLRKSPTSNARALIFKNTYFSWSSVKVTKMTKF